MMRPRYIWLAFVICLAVVTLAMGWISHTVFRLETAEIQAARQSENERLALWRMDSTLMPLITKESARPAYEYQPFYQPEGLYTTMFSPIDASRLQSRSSLISQDNPLIRLHFQYEADGKTSSPQVPTQNRRDFTEAQNFSTFECIESHARELEALQKQLAFADLDKALPRELEPEPVPASDDAQIAEVQPNAAGDFQADEFPMQSALPQQLVQPLQQKRYWDNSRSVEEYKKRQGAAQKNTIQANPEPTGKPFGLAEEAAEFSETKTEEQSLHGPMHAMWHGELLLLVRRTRVEGRESIQGCLLNWPEIRGRLLLDITDLLPQAELVPVTDANANPRLLLATLPVWLSPGAAPLEFVSSVTPLRLSLLIAWGGVFLAALAVAVLLLCVVRLSERRARLSRR